MEIIAVIFSLISVWFTARKNILCWSTGMIGVIAYSYIFYQHNEWGNFLLQFVFLGQSIWGWMNWNKSDNLRITSLELIDLLTIIEFGIITFFGFHLFIGAFNGHFTTLDSITTILSFVGMFLLGRGKLESWIFWMIADVIYIYFFFLSKLYLSSGLYFIFLILAIYGYFNWKKQLKK